MPDPTGYIAIGLVVLDKLYAVYRGGQSATTQIEKIVDAKVAIVKADAAKDTGHAVDMLRAQMDHLSDALENLSDLLREAMKTMRDDVTTKQDHLQLLMRVDSLEHQSRAYDKDITRLKDNCAMQGHKLRETSGVNR